MEQERESMSDAASALGPWLLGLLIVPALAVGSSQLRGQGAAADRLAVLEADNRRLQVEVARLRADQGTLARLSQYVWVDPSRDAVVFSGANVYIQSGSGATDDHGALQGRGNLIVGYDDDAPAQRGSHNVILGEGNTWSSYGGLVVGSGNVLAGSHALVVGSMNVVQGSYGAVSGSGNVLTGNYASVSGAQNIARGDFSAVEAAFRSEAAGSHAAVIGGADALAEEVFSTIHGAPLVDHTWREVSREALRPRCAARHDSHEGDATAPMARR